MSIGTIQLLEQAAQERMEKGTTRLSRAQVQACNAMQPGATPIWPRRHGDTEISLCLRVSVAEDRILKSLQTRRIRLYAVRLICVSSGQVLKVRGNGATKTEESGPPASL